MSELSPGPDDNPSTLELPVSGELKLPENPWKLVAYGKKVLHGWQELCRQIPGNAERCYEWLAAHPTQRIPGRCYELKHRHYRGIWCYEAGAGQRIYYKPRAENRDVLIYYAGQHPRKVPYPPSDL